jgi:hypothetical protein
MNIALFPLILVVSVLVIRTTWDYYEVVPRITSLVTAVIIYLCLVGFAS